MPLPEPSALLSPPVVNAVTSRTDTASQMTRDYGREDERRQQWQDLIDHKLIEWGCDPNQFAEDGVEPLTAVAIQRAIELATVLRDSGETPLFSVVPDVNGGIVFEYREGDAAYVFHVWEDGRVECCVFQGTSLIERWPL